jgi:hypothetical protein
VNRGFAKRKKERKDAEKQRRDRKRKEKEARDKANRALEKEGKPPIPTPDSTPEPESPSSAAAGQVDYSMWLESDTEGAGGRSPGQRRADTEPPAQAEYEDTHAQSPAEGSPPQPGAGTLEGASLPRGQTGPDATSGGCSAGASGLSPAPKGGSKKRKLGAASGYVSLCLFSAFLHTTPFWF